MAICTIEGKGSIDCGAGHGCGLICEHNGKHCWGGCSSRLVTIATGKNKDETLKALKKSSNLTLCCHNLQFSKLARLLQELVPYKVSPPTGKANARITKRFKGSLEQIVRSTGLTVHRQGETKQ
jgi:hypothetical protein